MHVIETRNFCRTAHSKLVHIQSAENHSPPFVGFSSQLRHKAMNLPRFFAPQFNGWPLTAMTSLIAQALPAEELRWRSAARELPNRRSAWPSGLRHRSDESANPPIDSLNLIKTSLQHSPGEISRWPVSWSVPKIVS